MNAPKEPIADAVLEEPVSAKTVDAVKRVTADANREVDIAGPSVTPLATDNRLQADAGLYS